MYANTTTMANANTVLRENILLQLHYVQIVTRDIIPTIVVTLNVRAVMVAIPTILHLHLIHNAKRAPLENILGPDVMTVV